MTPQERARADTASARIAVTFFCAGVPQPKGSGKALRNKWTGKPTFVPDNPAAKPWQMVVALEARAGGVRELVGAVEVRLQFFLPRPAGHFKSRAAADARLKASAPSAPTTRKADVDKLVRAVLDALTGLAYGDDSQVTAVSALKRWATPEQPPGVRVTVTQDTTA